MSDRIIRNVNKKLPPYEDIKISDVRYDDSENHGTARLWMWETNRGCNIEFIIEDDEIVIIKLIIDAEDGIYHWLDEDAVGSGISETLKEESQTDRELRNVSSIK